MLKQKINEVKEVRKQHPRFFWFAVLVFFLFGLQMVLKIEITPLGYFSLYSDPSYRQKEYKQILPAFTGAEEKPVNIYEAPGTGFLMLEILPSRYDILSKSDHCNQVNHKLQRLGLHDSNQTDCQELKNFGSWFSSYMRGLGMDSSCILVEYGFKDARLINASQIYNGAE